MTTASLNELYRRIDDIDTQCIEIAQDLIDLENEIKQAFMNFISYKDTADYIDLFEETLMELSAE